MRIEIEIRFLDANCKLVGTERYVGNYTTRRGERQVWRNAYSRALTLWYDKYDSVGGWEMREMKEVNI